MRLPPNSALTSARQIATRIASNLLSSPTISTILTARNNSDNIGRTALCIHLLPGGRQRISRNRFRRRVHSLFRRMPNTHVTFRDRKTKNRDGSLAIILGDSSPVTLQRASSTLAHRVHNVPNLISIDSDTDLIHPRIRVVPSHSHTTSLNMAIRTVTTATSLTALNSASTGLTSFGLNSHRVPVHIRVTPRFHSSPLLLRALQIPDRANSLIPLSTITGMHFNDNPTRVSHFSHSHRIAVNNGLRNLALNRKLTLISRLPALRGLPPDIARRPTNSTRVVHSVFAHFNLTLTATILVVFTILILLCGDFVCPITIVTTLPLSINNTLVNLLVFRGPLNLFTLVNVILLVNLIAGGTVLLMSCTLVTGRQNGAHHSTIIRTKIAHFHPVLVASVSAVTKVIPVTLRLKTNNRAQDPVTVTIVNNFAASALLALIIIPILCACVSHLGNVVNGLVRHLDNNNSRPRPPTPRRVPPGRCALDGWQTGDPVVNVH